jgi:hypothetical protein
MVLGATSLVEMVKSELWNVFSFDLAWKIRYLFHGRIPKGGPSKGQHAALGARGLREDASLFLNSGYASCTLTVNIPGRSPYRMDAVEIPCEDIPLVTTETDVAFAADRIQIGHALPRSAGDLDSA